LSYLSKTPAFHRGTICLTIGHYRRDGGDVAMKKNYWLPVFRTVLRLCSTGIFSTLTAPVANKELLRTSQGETQPVVVDRTT